MIINQFIYYLKIFKGEYFFTFTYNLEFLNVFLATTIIEILRTKQMNKVPMSSFYTSFILTCCDFDGSISS